MGVEVLFTKRYDVSATAFASCPVQNTNGARRNGAVRDGAFGQGSPAAMPTACWVNQPKSPLECIRSGGESVLGVSLLRFGVPVHLRPKMARKYRSE